jgi:hypothetical protein
MSKYDKLVNKLLDRKSTITYQEIKYLLTKLGYVESTKGKTSGSRVAYYNVKSKHIIRLHKPHPGNELKHYVKKAIITELTNKKLI